MPPTFDARPSAPLPGLCSAAIPQGLDRRPPSCNKGGTVPSSLRRRPLPLRSAVQHVQLTGPLPRGRRRLRARPSAATAAQLFAAAGALAERAAVQNFLRSVTLPNEYTKRAGNDASLKNAVTAFHPKGRVASLVRGPRSTSPRVEKAFVAAATLVSGSSTRL